MIFDVCKNLIGIIHLFIITLYRLIKMLRFFALGWDYINPSL